MQCTQCPCSAEVLGEGFTGLAGEGVEESIAPRVHCIALQVCNYPFTTRGVIMGHFKVGDEKHQVSGITVAPWGAVTRLQVRTLLR